VTQKRANLLKKRDAKPRVYCKVCLAMMAGLPGIQLYFRGEKMVNKNREVNSIDEGWLRLIVEAKKLGLPVELVRAFLTQSGHSNSNQQRFPTMHQ
jgi:hypothetical protein